MYICAVVSGGVIKVEFFPPVKSSHHFLEVLPESLLI